MSNINNIKKSKPNGGFPPIKYSDTDDNKNKLSKERKFINPIKNVNIRDIFKTEIENKKLIDLNIEENKDNEELEVV
jgi:hypothetical protein